MVHWSLCFSISAPVDLTCCCRSKTPFAYNSTVDAVELYANGVLLRQQQVKSTGAEIEKQRLQWTIARPPHDVYLVAIASGPGVRSPHWAIPRPYQPTS